MNKCCKCGASTDRQGFFDFYICNSCFPNSYGVLCKFCGHDKIMVGKKYCSLCLNKKCVLPCSVCQVLHPHFHYKTDQQKCKKCLLVEDKNRLRDSQMPHILSKTKGGHKMGETGHAGSIREQQQQQQQQQELQQHQPESIISDGEESDSDSTVSAGPSDCVVSKPSSDISGEISSKINAVLAEMIMNNKDVKKVTPLSSKTKRKQEEENIAPSPPPAAAPPKKKLKKSEMKSVKFNNLTSAFEEYCNFVSCTGTPAFSLPIYLK